MENPSSTPLANLVSFITNSRRMLSFVNPLPAQMDTVACLVREAEVDGLFFECVPNDPATLRLGESVSASATVSCLTIVTNYTPQINLLMFLSAALENRTSLTRFRLCNTKMEGALVGTLGAFVSDSPVMRSVKFTHCLAPIGTVAIMITQLRGTRTLVSLDLEGTRLEISAIEALCGSLHCWPYLSRLKLRDTTMNPSSVITLGHALAEGKVGLQVLDLQGNFMNDECTVALVEGLIECGRRRGRYELRKLSMEKSWIVATGCEAVARLLLHSPRMESVNIISNNFVSIAATNRILAESFRISARRSLRKVILTDCKFWSEAIIALCDALSGSGYLSALTIIGSQIRQEGAKALSALLPTLASLSELDLTSNDLIATPELIVGLSRTKLRVLKLGRNQGVVTDELITALHTNSLEELVIDICKADDTAAKALGGLISRSQRLRYLNLSRNLFQAAGVNTICEAISQSKSMRCLWMDGIKLGTEGARSVAENVISKCESLMELHIGWTHMEEAGADAVAKAIVDACKGGRSELKVVSVSKDEKGIEKLQRAELEVAGSISVELY